VCFDFLHNFVSNISFFLWRCAPKGAIVSSFTRFLDHTQWRTTISRTPLDEGSARRSDFYLTTHNTHTRQISMLQRGIRTRYLSRRAAADLRLRPRDNWEMFLIQRRIQRGNVTNVYWSSCQVLLSLVWFQSNVNFLERF